MVGYFGLTGSHRELLRVPLGRFVDAHPSISVFDLYRTDQTARPPEKIWIDDQPVVIGSQGTLMTQPVFICPGCGRTRYKLFEVGGRWACYRCHGLTYASRHTNRTIPGWHRLMRLRRKLGADPRPFTPLPSFTPWHHAKRKIVAEIVAIETRLIEHLRHDVNSVVEHRNEERIAHRKKERT